jgi:hypothetical protein
MSEAMLAVGALLVADAKTIGAITVVKMSMRCADGFFSYKDVSVYELRAFLTSGDNATVECVDTKEAAHATLSTYAKQLGFVYVAPSVIARQDDVASVFVQERERPYCSSVATPPLKEEWRVWIRIGSIGRDICIQSLSNFNDAANYVSMYRDAHKNGQLDKLRNHGETTVAAAAAAGKQ